MVDRQRKDLLLALAVSLAAVTTLCVFLQPRWETNDDVAMSMVAHGYGISVAGSPNLFFSNVIWGYFVRLIPQINGILGYSTATLAILVAFCTFVLYALRKTGLNWLLACAVAMLLLVRPVLFPQFTINSGLLTVGAVVCWHLYGRQGGRRTLIVGCLFAFAGFLIRSQEFLLVLLVSFPLLPWRKLVHDRDARMAALSLLIAICGSIFVDRLAYQSEDWKRFSELNSARAPFTDFGAGPLLKAQPEIVPRHGYSNNDIDLISTWFFVDPKIANPVALNAMISELGPIPTQQGALTKGWLGIKALINPVLTPLVLAAILLLLTRPSRKLFLIWGLCLAAFFALGMLGRPGVIRVYIPVLSLLVIVPLFTPGPRDKGQHIIRYRLTQVAVLMMAIFNAALVFSESKADEVSAGLTRSGLYNLPNTPIISWGSAFPFEAVYPVLKQSDAALEYQLYSMGVFTLAPFSLAYFEQSAGRGLVDLLTSKHGALMIADERRYRSLNMYCSEHLHGALKELASTQYGQVRVAQIRCDSEEVQ